MAYRGATRTFSNRYHFDNLAPADATKWGALSDAIVLAEKAIYSAGSVITIVGTTGYDAGSEIPVYSKNYSTVGTGSFGANVTAPGDAAALMRYSTGQKSVKNHPIYLFNYFHGACYGTAADRDLLIAAQRTAMLTYGAAWVTGFSDGSVTHHRCGPQGHVALGVTVDQWIRHRDFPAA